MAKTAAHSQDQEPGVHVRATPARQGFLDRDILAVLAVSTILAIIVVFAALAFNSPSLDRNTPETNQTPPTATVATPGPLPTVD